MEQRVLTAAIETRMLAIERQCLHTGRQVDFRHHPDMQTPIEHGSGDLPWWVHMDIDAHPGSFCLEPSQGMSNAHLRITDQSVGDADVELAAQIVMQGIDLG